MRRRLTMAMALLFATGSVCFALGSFPPYFSRVPGHVVGATFFVGSIFFTTAAYVQYYLALNPDGGARRVLRWSELTDDVVSSGIQLIGTLFFNVSTLAATAASLSVVQYNRLVWAPDVFGSVAFLASSMVAYRAVKHLGASRRGPLRTEWVISADNLAGSVAFGVSAIAALIVPTTGQVVNIHLVNLGTFIGAAMFLAAAVVTAKSNT